MSDERNEEGPGLVFVDQESGESVAYLTVSEASWERRVREIVAAEFPSDDADEVIRQLRRAGSHGSGKYVLYYPSVDVDPPEAADLDRLAEATHREEGWVTVEEAMGANNPLVAMLAVMRGDLLEELRADFSTLRFVNAESHEMSSARDWVELSKETGIPTLGDAWRIPQHADERVGLFCRTFREYLTRDYGHGPCVEALYRAGRELTVFEPGNGDCLLWCFYVPLALDSPDYNNATHNCRDALDRACKAAGLYACVDTRHRSTVDAGTNALRKFACAYIYGSAEDVPSPDLPRR